MRRAASIVVVSLLAVTLLTLGLGAQQSTTQLFSGTGLLDYSRRPHWKVGTWVRYKMDGSSEKGYRDDYTVTLVIAGEEVFWGDTCFWLETWTEQKDRPKRAFAVLMSYSVFDDTLAWARATLYSRKYIASMDEDGNPRQELYLRTPESLKSRKGYGEDRRRNFVRLGEDTVSVAVGTFHAEKYEHTYFIGTTQIKGDSTFYEETHESTKTFFSDQIPITRIVKQDLDRLDTRKAWLIGQSQDAPERVRDHGRGTVELTGWGTDAVGLMVPPEMRRSIAEQAAPARRKAGAKPRTG
jgi:hypothetical protein